MKCTRKQSKNAVRVHVQSLLISLITLTENSFVSYK